MAYYTNSSQHFTIHSTVSQPSLRQTDVPIKELSALQSFKNEEQQKLTPVTRFREVSVVNRR